MSREGGRCHDNARCESLWVRMKCELLYDQPDNHDHRMLQCQQTEGSTPDRRAFLVLTFKLQWEGNWPDETFKGLTMSGC